MADQPYSQDDISRCIQLARESRKDPAQLKEDLTKEALLDAGLLRAAIDELGKGIVQPRPPRPRPTEDFPLVPTGRQEDITDSLFKNITLIEAQQALERVIHGIGPPSA